MSKNPFLPMQSVGPETMDQDPAPQGLEDTDTDTDTQPDPHHALVSAGRKRLTHDQVAKIREAYMWARATAWAADTAEQWENVATTEARLGREFGLSATSVHNLVLGITYPDAPGPVDLPRRAAYDRYRADVAKYGVNVARSRSRDTNPTAPQLRLEVKDPDGKVTSQVLSPGSVVRLEYVAGSPAQD